eukprot:337827_1
MSASDNALMDPMGMFPSSSDDNKIMIMTPCNYHPEKNELLVTGFMREWNKQRDDTKVTKQVPNELFKDIVLYFPLHEIKFANGTISYKKHMACFAPTTGLLNTLFTDKLCNKFEIKFQYGGNDLASIYCTLGYLYEWKDIQTHRMEFGHGALGEKRHTGNKSIGVTMRGPPGGPPTLYINNAILNHSSTLSIGSTSIIRMVFDFNNNSFSIYHKFIMRIVFVIYVYVI